jgi:hypothetical protein
MDTKELRAGEAGATARVCGKTQQARERSLRRGARPEGRECRMISYENPCSFPRSARSFRFSRWSARLEGGNCRVVYCCGVPAVAFRHEPLLWGSCAPEPQPERRCLWAA